MKHFVEENYYDIVSDVTCTWSNLKSNPDWKENVGVELFTRMFKLAPGVWSQFPWARGVSHEDLASNESFVAFVRNFVGMLDMAIDMLGPDLDLVEGELQKLGARHIRYGILPEHYPLMGRALVDTIRHFLGDRFDERLLQSWNSMYTFMSITMLQGAFEDLIADREKYHVMKNQAVKQARRDSARSQCTASTSESSGSPNESPRLTKNSSRLSYTDFIRRFTRNTKNQT